MESFKVKTGSKTEFKSITDRVASVVRESGVEEGICIVYVPHTTAAVTINENADPSVKKDILMEVNKVIPFEDGYSHMEGNSAAHIKSTLVGESVTIPISGGSLALGTWQGIFFCEFDGPRSRKVHVTVQEAG
jgi:secondary thiamine-phosphate synthase enzyme